MPFWMTVVQKSTRNCFLVLPIGSGLRGLETKRVGCMWYCSWNI